jgi:uncharacterized membrane protein
MATLVFVAVLFAAACHAGWNALIKVGLDPLSATILIAIGAAAVSLAGLPETSVLFGAIIAIVALKEPLRAARIVAAALIACGLLLIRLQ